MTWKTFIDSAGGMDQREMNYFTDLFKFRASYENKSNNFKTVFSEIWINQIFFFVSKQFESNQRKTTKQELKLNLYKRNVNGNSLFFSFCLEFAWLLIMNFPICYRYYNINFCLSPMARCSHSSTLGRFANYFDWNDPSYVHMYIW